MKEKQRCKFLVKGGKHSQLEYLTETDDLNEVTECISVYASKTIKKIYYYRINFEEKFVWIDFGSWSEFIYVYFLDLQAKEEFLNGYSLKKE